MENKILIAVDNQINSDRFKDNLLKYLDKIEVLSANNGTEACKMALSAQPDLIVLDWKLTEINGYTLLKRLKNHDLTKNTPVMMIIDERDEESLVLSLKAGATYVLDSAISTSEFVARVQSALSLSSTLKTLHSEHQKLQLANHRNETILNAILPSPILSQLKKYGAIPPRVYKNTAVIFVDMVDFTPKTSELAPRALLKELNDLFSGFDRIIERHHCTRIKTIGDAYMAACGMFDAPENIALEAASAALKIRQYLINRNLCNPVQWELKIGIYCGDVMGSSVSPTNLSFDIFGETVNMASRFQELCEPMQINVSKKLKKHLEQSYKFVERTPRTVKGKGVMPMFYLHHPIYGENETKKKSSSTTETAQFELH